ncbi:DNA-binding protein, partial [Enterococcus faecalis]
STVLWFNLIGAVFASGVLLSTRLASKVEVPGIQKGRKEVGKNTNKTVNKDWTGKILGVAVLAMILLTFVSSISRISSIDEI